MAQKDKIKWDKKYNETPSLLKDRKHSKKLENIIDKVKKGRGLEIACGTGRNSIYLANHGFKIDALDISAVALEFLKAKNIENIDTKEVDLEGYIPLKDTYDIVVMTNYLDRDIIPHLFNALKKEGIVFIETYMNHELNTKPNSNPDFLLKEGELKSFFKNDCEVLEYEEFDNEPTELHRMRKQLIIVKKL